MNTMSFFYRNLLVVMMLCGIITASCSKHNKISEQTLNINITTSTDILNEKQLVEEVTKISLQASPELPLSSLDKVFEINSLYYILDKNQGAVFCYDSLGTLVRKYHKRGHARNEYITLKDVACNDTSLYLLAESKIIILDNTLNYTGIIDFRDLNIKNFYGIDRIAVVEEELFCYDNNSRKVVSLSIKDNYQNYRTIFHESTHDCSMIGLSENEDVFYPISESEMLFIPSGEDRIYKLEDETFFLWGIMNYPGKDLCYKNDLNQNTSIFDRKTPCRIYDVFIANDNLYFKYTNPFGYFSIDRNHGIKDYIGWKKNVRMEDYEVCWDYSSGKKWYALVENEDLFSTSKQNHLYVYKLK